MTAGGAMGGGGASSRHSDSSGTPAPNGIDYFTYRIVGLLSAYAYHPRLQGNISLL